MMLERKTEKMAPERHRRAGSQQAPHRAQQTWPGRTRPRQPGHPQTFASCSFVAACAWTATQENGSWPIVHLGQAVNQAPKRLRRPLAGPYEGTVTPHADHSVQPGQAPPRVHERKWPRLSQTNDQPGIPEGKT